MLIDWVTARIPLGDLSDAAREECRTLGDRIVRYCPRTGEERYTTAAWDSIRSDSHQVAVRVGSDLWVQGSPARVFGVGDSVFGAGPSAGLDLVGCVQGMVNFVAKKLGVILPHAKAWIVSRVDVTGNLAMASAAEVRQALTVLRNCEGGRYRVSSQQGDTVYWSHRSKLRSGKAYHKGPHLAYLMRLKGEHGKRYEREEIEQAGRLLRLELKLGREFWARHDWREATRAMLVAEWEGYFGRMVGGAEMSSEQHVKDRIIAAAKTEGQGKAAYGCWLMIQKEGWEKARECYAVRTWYHHLKTLRAAGLGDADISAGQVVPVRRRVMEAQLVTSWAQLRAA